VEALLGIGSMGEVYKVWDEKRATYLAMKLLREDFAEDQVFLRRFRREAQTLAKLQHPNIIRFYGMEQDGPLVFTLMDYVQGYSLRREIIEAGGPLALQRVLEIMQSVCAALHYTYQQGFIHCDIKPGNIMIDKKGAVYLTDFGIARMTESATATMVGAGTPDYMSPEQVRGEEPIPQMDIYALGIMLFEMLTGGKRPFTGEHAKISGSAVEKVRWEQIYTQPPSPRKFNPGIFPALEAVVLKCLEKDSGKRYRNALELLNALQAAIGSQPAVAVPGSLPEPPPYLSSLPTKRHPRWGLALALALGGIFLTLNIIFDGDRLPHLVIPTMKSTIASIPMPGSLPTLTFVSMPTTTSIPSPTSTEIPTTSSSPAWEQGKLLFTIHQGDSYQLNSLNLTNWKSEVLYISSLGKLAYSATWSPDGEKVAFYIFREETMVFQVSTQSLPVSLYRCGYPTWSPDGKRIVCSENGIFYILDSASGVILQTLVVEPGALLPQWSPLDDGIMYAQFRGENTEIRFLPFGTSGNSIALAAEGTENYAPSWSPNGNWIAFQSNRNSPQSDIWIANRSGNQARQITFSSGAWSRAPVWSPDGKWLAFISNRESSIGADFGEVFVISIETGETIKITSTNGTVYDWRVSWSK